MTEISILRRTALAATTLLLAACGPPAPPAYDPATLEPQVVARIDEAQAEADVVRGFQVSHMEILTDDASAAQVLAALDRCRGDTDAPRIAPRPLGE